MGLKGAFLPPAVSAEQKRRYCRDGDTTRRGNGWTVGFSWGQAITLVRWQNQLQWIQVQQLGCVGKVG